ncbi:UDP-3-O-(3-hydroxymyristoyl)glucosamine N-acyltransferase [Desulfogranum japonicum]|uniref:UDP-3-O-(3-hydroxymyristoyl)glucosamine N-acyltransferase n=1 Tax=Desulfogranum japonicum TaxID=231447 RepID=UPI00040F13D8|nr:UDP-3-O-(3-hydroxymyristoyl)glucosamine N-acyltransferase [Desulfogranum japonicum]
MSRSYSLQELAEYVGGVVVGDPLQQISGLNGFDLAGPGEITYLNTARQVDEKMHLCQAGACIIPVERDSPPVSCIIIDPVDIAAARIHNLLLETPFQAKGIHPQAVLGSDCEVADEVTIGPMVVVGDRVRIGKRVTLYPGVVLGDDVIIGDDTTLHANVTVADGCTIGKRVVLYHGAVVGSDGFGFVTDRTTGSHITKPQVGTVRIDDDVQIGANSCVDRAAFGVTWIKSGTRIDNLVQVAHNVEIGENSILVAQVGIAGSTRLGRNVVLGAKVGINGHIHLDDGVMVAAMGGVHNSQPKGAMVGGVPAIEVKKWGRSAAAYSRLPEMVKEVRRLRKEVDQLKATVSRKEK